MVVAAGQTRSSTLSDVILKRFEQANLYTPRRRAFSHLVYTQINNLLYYIEQHQQNAQFLLGRVRKKTKGFLNETTF